MSEPIWCNVECTVPTSWADGDNFPPFIAMLNEALINGRVDSSTDSDGMTHWTVSGEGNYGLADDDVVTVLDYMREHRIPFIATDDTKYEMIGTLIAFDGEDEKHADWCEGIALFAYRYEGIVAGTSDYKSVEEYFAVGQNKVCNGLKLPAECPVMS